MTGRKRKNWVKYVGGLILIAVMAGGGFLVWKSFETREPEAGDEPVVTEPAEVKEDEKKEEVEDEVKSEESKVDTGKEEIKQFDGNDPNAGEKLTGVITYAGVNDGNLMVRVNIDQYLTEGTCKLELVRGESVVYNETVGVIDSAATATCEGFNVPIAEIGSGSYQIIIKITSGEKAGVIRGEVNV